MPIVLIPPPYRGPTGGQERIEVAANTVRACIEAVEAAHPGFLPQVFAADGEPHKFVKLFVNGDQSPPEAEVAEGDEVEVLAAIAGG
ncbi:MAG: MoaD/ThiS family protein [Deltaproteobacteria bacterium]|nr:MoaD/ThiS family protein [Deltaproteobacteria bacterium]MBW2445433.1 MoaD/ThiS family protein [Deltaproteobacteria bacterium]